MESDSARACREIRESLRIRPVAERTFVVVAAVHQDRSANNLNKVALTSVSPIGGGCHNAYDESFAIDCYAHLALGYVPISFVMESDACQSWESRVPAPESVVLRLLSEAQRAKLDAFKAQHRDDPVRYEYLQFLDNLSE